jgi:hypothetical protein
MELYMDIKNLEEYVINFLECFEELDLEDLKSLQEYVLRLKKENERLQKELSLLLLSQITENDQKLGLYE